MNTKGMVTEIFFIVKIISTKSARLLLSNIIDYWRHINRIFKNCHAVFAIENREGTKYLFT